jgi:hypothetical protein
LLAHGWWFSPGIPASSTTKTGRHDIAEALLKVALKTNQTKQNVNNIFCSISSTPTNIDQPILPPRTLFSLDVDDIKDGD